MRLQLDTETAKRMENYRNARGLRTTRGHADTIRALLDDAGNVHALQHISDSIEAALADFAANLPFTMATAANDALHALILRAVSTILGTSHPRTAATPLADLSGATNVHRQDANHAHIAGHADPQRTPARRSRHARRTE